MVLFYPPEWHPQLLLASGKEDKWLLCSGATPGLLCLYLVSIVVFYLESSSVSITLVYFEPFHFSPPPVEFLFRDLDLLKREAQPDELFSKLRIIHIGLFFLPYA